MQAIMQTMLTTFQATMSGASAVNTPKSENTPKLPKLKDLVVPTFNGDRAFYISYKDGIISYLDSTKCEKKFRGHYIFDSLRGEARKHIGEGESWINREKDLWERLDGKYGCKWTMMAELVKSALCTESPTDCGKNIM